MESRVQRAVQRLIKSIGGKSVKFHGNAFTEAGTPDILGVAPLACPHCGGRVGRAIAIETKSPYTLRQAEPLQKIRLGEWSSGGALAGVARSLEEAEGIMYDEESLY